MKSLTQYWQSILAAFRHNSTPKAAASETTLEKSKALVNYIWINSKKAAYDHNNPVCAIEMAYIQRALDNANRYPEADFKLWVDKKLLDPYSLLCVESFINERAKNANVLIHDLQEIKDYAADEYFVPPESTKKSSLSDTFNRSAPRNVYSRADYARILVLDHCMQTYPAYTQLIYSDIDCPNVRLPEAAQIIRAHGIAVYDMGGGGRISHGYIGIDPQHSGVKKHFPTLKSRTGSSAHYHLLGYVAFGEFLSNLGLPIEKSHKKIGLPNLLPAMFSRPNHLSYAPGNDVVKTWKKRKGPLYPHLHHGAEKAVPRQNARQRKNG